MRIRWSRNLVCHLSVSSTLTFLSSSFIVLFMEIGKVVELEISSLAYGGKGVAKFMEAGVPYSVFVSMTVPGDIVQAKIVSLRHRFAEASLVEIKKKSPDRAAPPCPFFGECGGCDWQHVKYPVQLREKQRLVREAVEKAQKGGFDLLQIIPSEPYGYRDRARFHSDKGSKDYILGLKARQSNKIVDIDQCLVCSPQINRRLALARAGKEGPILDFATSSVVPLNEFGVSLHYYPQCFTQSNFTQNVRLVKVVLDMLDLKEDDTILDLYSGIGNFGLPASKLVKSVVGIEGSPASVMAASENARSHRIRNASFRHSDVLGWLKGHKLKFDAVIADPPRDGLGDAFRFLNGSNIKRVVLVSCDLRSLSVDLRSLTNYRVDKVQPIDMSPQTYHVETVVLLKKKGQNS